jgi:hypothetical protein
MGVIEVIACCKHVGLLYGDDTGYCIEGKRYGYYVG